MATNGGAAAHRRRAAWEMGRACGEAGAWGTRRRRDGDDDGAQGSTRRRQWRATLGDGMRRQAAMARRRGLRAARGRGFIPN
uniref:Uncharacterized protein n=1 Tax=Oryza sativa subsp. japonica TaxID=39947 RepID=Q8GVL4_ORYSJ|nr:hypothetical protein [Oryza sativa Japonica Group]